MVACAIQRVSSQHKVAPGQREGSIESVHHAVEQRGADNAWILGIEINEQLDFDNAFRKRSIEVKLFVYLNAKDPSIVGAALLNGVMDALDTTFALSGGDLVLGRNTLNGTAYHCKIDGKPLKDPGDLDGEALLIVPVKLVLP